MTDKMSKEEARSILNELLSRNQFEHVAKVKAYVLEIVDSIEPEHKKVVLPKAVGEQWDKLVSYYSTIKPADAIDLALIDTITSVSNQDKKAICEWQVDGRHNYYPKLIDAARYGWVPKSEKIYRVKVYGIDLPGLFYWKRDDGTLSFVQGGAGQPETEFTTGEIKRRHLEHCEREEVTDNEND